MTDELIEVVARAIIREEHGADHIHDKDSIAEHDLGAAKAALQAIQSSGTFMVVPVEPTKQMIEAGISAAEEVEDWTQDSFETYRVDGASDMPKPVYKAMLAACK